MFTSDPEERRPRSINEAPVPTLVDTYIEGVPQQERRYSLDTPAKRSLDDTEYILSLDVVSVAHSQQAVIRPKKVYDESMAPREITLEVIQFISEESDVHVLKGEGQID